MTDFGRPTAATGRRALLATMLVPVLGWGMPGASAAVPSISAEEYAVPGVVSSQRTATGGERRVPGNADGVPSDVPTALTIAQGNNSAQAPATNAEDEQPHTLQAQAPAETLDLGPYDPSTPEGASVWANEMARSTDPRLGVKLDILAIHQDSPTASGTSTSDTANPTASGTDNPADDSEDSARTPGSLSMNLRLTNGSPQPLTNLSLQVLQQKPLTTPSAIRFAQLANYGEYPESSPELPLTTPLPPGQTQELTLTLRETPDPTAPTTASNTLIIPSLFTPGSHPVMVAVNATTLADGQSEPAQQLVALMRTTLHTTPPNKTPTTTPTPLTFLWPLAASTHTLGGATGEAPQRAPLYLSDENLAHELSPGGRLRILLDTYQQATDGPQGSALRQASCLAIDPELVDTVDRMAGGYRVSAQRPSPVETPRQLRDSWGKLFGDDSPDYQPGSGAEAARTWLDQLKALVAESCSVALPYAGANLSAIAHTNNDWLAVHALSQGPQIIHRVLGVWPTQNVVIPDAGYISPTAAPLLRYAATQGIRVDLGQLYETRSRQSTNNASETSAPVDSTPHRDPQTVTALVAENTLKVTAPSQQPETEAPAPGAEPSPQPGAGNTPAPMTAVDITDSIPQSPGTTVKTLAIGYSADLAAALRATGTNPEIAGYTDPAKRYDITADSPAARMATATAILQTQINAGKSLLAVPPAQWTIGEPEAQAFLSTIASNLTAGTATPTPLDSVLLTPTGTGTPVVPYTDPGEQSTQRAEYLSSQANAINDITRVLRNEPSIALSREAFTRPLYDDLLRASSNYGMRQRNTWAQVRTATRQRIASVETIITTLKNSVSLLPPGNVFTRTSDSSPLLIVARNGLPLPMEVIIKYTSEGQSPFTLTLPEATQTVPARGSVTVSLSSQDTGTSPNGGTANLTMWLASPTGEPISKAVPLRVQSVPGVSSATAGIILLLLLALGIGAKIFWNRRTSRSQKTHPQRLKISRK